MPVMYMSKTKWDQTYSDCFCGRGIAGENEKNLWYLSTCHNSWHAEALTKPRIRDWKSRKHYQKHSSQRQTTK